MRDLKVGDVVLLRGESLILLTVEVIPRKVGFTHPDRTCMMVSCAWFNRNNDLQRADFDIETLSIPEECNA